MPNSDGGFSSKILLDSIRKFDFDKDRIVVVFDDQNKGKPEFIDFTLEIKSLMSKIKS